MKQEILDLENKLTRTGFHLKLLEPKNALTVVHLLRKHDIKLQGFDGFILHGEAVQIEQNLSKDYSSEPADIAHNKAVEFLTTHCPPGALFELAFDRSQESKTT